MVWIEPGTGTVFSARPVKTKVKKSKARQIYSSASKRLKKTRKVRKSKTPLRKQFSRGSERLISNLMPVDLKRSRSSKAPKRRVGRPRGPSGKYNIRGVGPVGVYEWRRWYSQQQALRRTGGQQRDVYSYKDSPPESPQHVQQAPPQQYEEQRRRTILTPQDESILQAPNVARGELRNVGRSSSIINVDDLDRPITNKRGDYYADVDPASGKQILRRRIRERWLSNE